MKKATRNSVSILIVSVSLWVLAGCSKESNNCKVCQSRNSNNEVVAEKEVCSEQEEQAFRIQQEGRPVECQ